MTYPKICISILHHQNWKDNQKKPLQFSGLTWMDKSPGSVKYRNSILATVYEAVLITVPHPASQY